MEESENVIRPNLRLLKVLVVLSSISILSGLYQTITVLLGGAYNEEQIENFMAEQMATVKMLKNRGADDIAEMVIAAADLTVYQNNEVFISFNLFTLLSFIIGGIGVYFMYKLRKIGFHFYVIYSLLPIITLYLLMPLEIIPNFLVFGSLFIAALCCILYAMQLKHMK